ncbi:MAG: hypothetical protein LC768_14075 [Acidobacteria bacterium]|nr:hypothetical protein [Acidobacteriota bacterium]MCA1639440.1 hypothetical protein [Acidobacteriota bacterium]
MNLSKTDNRRRIIAGASAVLIGVSFLLNLLDGLNTGMFAPSQTMIALSGYRAVLNAVLMIATVFGISQLLRARADWIGLLGGASALVGWTASARIGVLIQLSALSESGVAAVPPNFSEVLMQSAPTVWTSIVPIGIFFPIGLITLGLALAWERPIHWWIGLLLALGGVLFPIGRAAGQVWAIIACDIILGAAFALIGWQILTRPELWAKRRGDNLAESQIAGETNV